MRKLIFNSLCNLMTNACAKTIVISLTLFIGKYCLCIGNAADILFSHRCNHQRRA